MKLPSIALAPVLLFMPVVMSECNTPGSPTCAVGPLYEQDSYVLRNVVCTNGPGEAVIFWECGAQKNSRVVSWSTQKTWAVGCYKQTPSRVSVTVV